MVRYVVPHVLMKMIFVISVTAIDSLKEEENCEEEFIFKIPVTIDVGNSLLEFAKKRWKNLKVQWQKCFGN